MKCNPLTISHDLFSGKYWSRNGTVLFNATNKPIVLYSLSNSYYIFRNLCLAYLWWHVWCHITHCQIVATSRHVLIMLTDATCSWDIKSHPSKDIMSSAANSESTACGGSNRKSVPLTLIQEARETLKSSPVIHSPLIKLHIDTLPSGKQVPRCVVTSMYWSLGSVFCLWGVNC